MPVEWTTAKATGGRQYAAWRDVCQAGYYPLHTETDAHPTEPFRAGFKIRNFGNYPIVDLAADRSRLIRHARQPAQGTVDTVHLILMMGTGAEIEYGRGSAITVEPNTVWRFDPNESFRFAPAGAWRHRVIRVARSTADAWMAPHHRHGGIVAASPRTGIGALLSATMQTLTETIGPVLPDAADATVRSLCQLLSLSHEPAAQREPSAVEAIRSARLGRARRIIEQRLGEPGLSPAVVAAALNISPRALHLLFEPTGTSFAQYVNQRRVEHARDALHDPGCAHRTIAEVAFAAGFADVSTFHRVFRRVVGVTPAEYRMAVLRQSLTNT